ncbi:hypothetical protein BO82DRAFT_420458 [Aspergillus uvarum CBS 121591]|uniref:Uncharacterized protein n=1 Tax=Aspergillus uvarum CBS 121591 TaxID=1448315 RepID=A0A319CT39_9EURO|nr:hypothetical protein BO82DRAFT_420458 [Aspergillus uvarum CBS 121591]PYH85927.1 hypothetical protein BO82DRAFT_420458 [Aspergillus uvarum CBS 121591]
MAFIGTAAEIRDELLKDDEPKRVIIRVNTKRLESHNYRGSACALVAEIFPDWETNERIRFLHIEIRIGRAFLAIDLNNGPYLPVELDLNPIPVYILSIFRRGWALVRWRQLDQHLADHLARICMLNYDNPVRPYLANYDLRELCRRRSVFS